MDKHDPVEFSLLGIHGRDKKADIQADYKQDRGRNREPGNQLSGQSVKCGRCGIFEPVYRQIITPSKCAAPAWSPTG